MKAQQAKEKVNTFVLVSLNRAGLRKQPKTFAVGFNKCGTTSLHALFVSKGLASYHGVNWRDCNDLKLLRSYDCFSDGIPKDISKLDTLFPNSKFILQVRELESWIYSRLAHVERGKKRSTDYGSHYWDNTNSAVKEWILERNAHHLSVLDYFSDRPSDLLIVNYIKDTMAALKIVDFLGFHGASQKPKANVNPQKVPPIAHRELLDNAIRELGITEEELKYDLYCPSLENSVEVGGIPPDTTLL